MVAPADPDDYRTRSLWLQCLPGELTPRPGLEGDRDCDVAIVGAGFTGLWSAYYLKRLQPDLRITVIEREIAGYGPSGRNGGFVLGGLVGPAAVFGLHGPELARAVAVTNVAVDEIGEVARREAIDCGYLKAGALSVATSEPQWQRLQSAPGDGRLLSAAETEAMVAVPGLHGGR
ncbi:MAG TPA: FAD-dependent oxidoreductase, partial [Solirubrobacteraceae bacterium]